MAQRKKSGRSGDALGVYLRPELMDVLEKYLASAQPRTTKTAIVELALMDYFRKLSLWPPPKSSRPASDE